MAGEEKNEAASPKRRQEAREKGNLPKSVDMTSAAVLIVAAAVLVSRFGPTVEAIAGAMAQLIEGAGTNELTADWLQQASVKAGMVAVNALWPVFAAVIVTAIAAGILQSGVPTSLKPLAPDFSRLNPLTGLQRLFSNRGVVELLKALAKVAILGWMGWSAVRALLLAPAAAYQPDSAEFMQVLLNECWSLGKRLLMVLIVIGSADFAYQRWSYEKSLRMTTQELKEEMKETEGNPLIKSRIRQRMRQMAQRRMMQQVPQAQVVITNPTHYAIALKYTPPMKAPKVVAKGADLMALRIRELAKKSRVPIVSNPPLAQALYKAVDIEQEIPGELYQAVAEVLAYIYRLRHGIKRERSK